MTDSQVGRRPRLERQLRSPAPARWRRGLRQRKYRKARGTLAAEESRDHAGLQGDILFSIDSISEDATSYRLAHRMVIENLARSCITRDEFAMGVPRENEIACGCCNVREHGRVGSVSPAHFAGGDVDGDYGIFFAGRFLKQTQPGRNLNYWALWSGYKF